MRRWRGVVVAAAVAAGFGHAPQAAAQGKAPPAAYDIARSQSVQDAPAGYVGRKTTDREHRVGKQTQAGRVVDYVLVFGGFARRCPTAEGIVEGNFEYALTYDEAITTGGATRQTHQARRLVARLRGHVGDDARLQRVELEGEFTVERSGTDAAPSSERRAVRTTFRPGTSGEPDFDAMRTAVEATADIAVASVVLGAGTVYRQAETEWLKKNACVEFEFDPPSDERRVGPNQATQVRVGLRTREGKAFPVPFETEHINVIDGAGSVSPRRARAQPGERAPLTYTASSRPRRGHGIDIATLSRAGLAEGEWRILDLGRFEGSFTQTDTADVASGLGAGTDVQKVTAKLVWTPEEAKAPSAPSFGDVRSSFFRPSSGEITVDLQYRFRDFAGSTCKQQARKSFPIAGLPENLLRFLWLEIAEDGRYKLSLGLPDRVWQVWSMEVEAVCTFPGGNVSRDRARVNEVAVQLGVHQGTLKEDQSIAGELPAPIRRGPRVITGNWSFTMKSD